MEGLSWSALEFEEKDRHPDWVWYAGLIFGIGATLSFFYSNIFFGIFLVVAGVAVIMFAGRKPRRITITIGEESILVDDDVIPQARIQKFWIDETGKPDKLLLLIKGGFAPMIALPLEGVTADAVRGAMAKHAPEEFLREPFGVKIAERLGF